MQSHACARDQVLWSFQSWTMGPNYLGSNSTSLTFWPCALEHVINPSAFVSSPVKHNNSTSLVGVGIKSVIMGWSSA